MKTTLEDKPFGFGLFLLLIIRYSVIVFGIIFLVITPNGGEKGQGFMGIIMVTAFTWITYSNIDYSDREDYVVSIVYHRILSTMLKTVILTYTAVVEFIFRRHYIKLQALVNNLDTLSDKMETNIIKFKEENKKLQ